MTQRTVAAQLLISTLWFSTVQLRNGKFSDNSYPQCAMRYKSEGPGIDSRCRRCFSLSSDSSMCPGVDSASKNEYQVNTEGKGGRCVRLKPTTFMCRCQEIWGSCGPQPIEDTPR